MKDAKWDLRDVSVDHYTRMQNAMEAAREGRNHLDEMRNTLLALKANIVKFEHLATNFNANSISVREHACADALQKWARCLPETAAQYHAGRDLTDILRAVLRPDEESRVLEITDLSGISEEA